MKQISSSQNPVFKNLRTLATSAKARREQNQTILEGIHLADAYLQNGGQPVSCVIGYTAHNNPEVFAIADRLEQLGVPVMVMSDSQVNTLGGVENGVGLVLVIEQPKAEAPAILDHSALLLDNVQDPGNVGAILRTAAAAGVTSVYCSAQTAAVWSPKVLRAGMGAHFAVKVYENSDLAALIKNAGVPVYATSLEATQTIYELDLSQASAWIVGNEGQGVSRELLNLAVKKVIIPQAVGVESLNVAAATAVCLFEQRRQSEIMGV